MNRTTYFGGFISPLAIAAVFILVVVAGGGGYYLIKKNEEQKDLGSVNTGILQDLEEFGEGKRPGKNAPTEWSASACDYFTLTEAQAVIGKDAVEITADTTANYCSYTVPGTEESLTYYIAFREYPLTWADELMKRGLDAKTHTQVFGTTDRAWYSDKLDDVSFAFAHKDVLAHLTYMGSIKLSVATDRIKPILRTVGERYPDKK